MWKHSNTSGGESGSVCVGVRARARSVIVFSFFFLPLFCVSPRKMQLYLSWPIHQLQLDKPTQQFLIQVKCIMYKHSQRSHI